MLSFFGCGRCGLSKLDFVEPCVNAGAREQLLVPAALGDLTILQDDDPVGMADR